MSSVLTARGAKLLNFEAIRIVALIFPRNVVAVLAHLTRQGNLRADIGRGHGLTSLFLWANQPARFARIVVVAVAGIEPATQRL